MAFARAAAALHEEMVELMLRDNRPIGEVFLAIEAARARSLSDEALRSSPRGERKKDVETDALRERVRALQMRLRQAEMEGRVDESARLHEEAAPLERALLARIHEQEIARAAAGENPTSQMPTLADVNDRLGNGVLLEFFTIRGAIQVLRMDGGQAAIYRDLASMIEVEEIIRKLYFQLNLCARHGESWMRQREDALIQSTDAYLRRLYDVLIGPLQLPGAGDLVIAPSGALHEVPFPALRSEQGYLGESRSITFTPSAAIWSRAKTLPGSGSPLIMGAPDTHAPLVDEEAREVAQAMGVRPHVGAAARRDVFFRHAPGASVIHLAAHATVRGDNPRFSSIHFDDGPLAIHDLDGLGFQAELAVLSACSTAAGTRQAGDETLSLARSFLGAGAHNVLVSLWPVWDRSTRSTMTTFYQMLAAGSTPGEALRLAQAAIRERYRHPYYWAPFVLVG
jgi:CHAT domain-containing protein